jgi:hypothetical protein
MLDEPERDRRLNQLLRAIRADADPALWTRARARIEARARAPWLVTWAMRPAALGMALATLVAACGLSLLLVASAPDSDDPTSATLIETILAERGIDSSTGLESGPSVAPESPAPAERGDSSRAG